MINLATGLATVNFYSIDPATSLPPPVNIGFLPPEDGTGRGMGYVTYTIEPKADLPENTKVRNIALISFDGQQQIATNQIDPHDPSKGTDPSKECLNTIVSKLPDLSPGGGDGGGGGGGGGSSGVTSLNEFVTGEGKFVVDATAESADGDVEIFIPKGTVGKNRNGGILRFISIKEQSDPPPPPNDCTFICLAYDIGPSGSTFEPPVYLIFKYNDSDIPAGITEHS